MGKRVRGIRVGSSDLNARRADVNAAHEQIQELLAKGWEIDCIKKRPRIKKEPQPVKVVISVFGKKLTLTWSEYVEKGNGFTIITKIY